jgi:hypothetical protein
MSASHEMLASAPAAAHRVALSSARAKSDSMAPVLERLRPALPGAGAAAAPPVSTVPIRRLAERESAREAAGFVCSRFRQFGIFTGSQVALGVQRLL